jgi:hypothetical protein
LGSIKEIGNLILAAKNYGGFFYQKYGVLHENLKFLFYHLLQIWVYPFCLIFNFSLGLLVVFIYIFYFAIKVGLLCWKLDVVFESHSNEHNIAQYTCILSILKSLPADKRENDANSFTSINNNH